MSRQALGFTRWTMKKWTRVFSGEENNECLPNFEVFNENEFLETSNDLDGRWNLFIYWRKSKRKYNRKDKNWPQVLKETRAIDEIPAEEINNLLCHFFVKVRKRNPSFLRSSLQQMHNCCRSEISTVTSSKTATRGYWFGRRWLSLKCCLTLFDLAFEFCLFCRVLPFRSFTWWPRTLLLNPKIIQFCLVPSLFSLQVWKKITTLRSFDRFDKFSFLTNQQQPHIKRAKPGPAGPLTRCSEVTLVCHATQTVYKRTTFPFCS